MVQSLKQIKCPKCGRKGLHYADHPHAQGYKDHSKAACRFCGARFRMQPKQKPAQ